MAGWLDDLREEEIVRRVMDDDRSTPGTRLGWQAARVQDEVLGFGQADFDAPVGHLSGADRVLLYAFFNQKGHVAVLCRVLGQLFASADRAGTPVVLDLGCGPFTAGLALAAVIGPDRPFHYFGVDRSVEMRKLGLVLAHAARRRGAIHNDTTVVFGDALDALDVGAPRWDITLAVASYLLASPTLDIDALSRSVVDAADRRGQGPAAFLYLNSAKQFPNAKWPTLRDALGAAGFEPRSDDVEDEVRCALLVREARTLLPIPGAP